MLLILRFNAKYMITRRMKCGGDWCGTATLWDFAAVCNPEVREVDQLQIRTLTNFPGSAGVPGFEFDYLQIVAIAGDGVDEDAFIIYDFLTDDTSDDDERVPSSDSDGVTEYESVAEELRHVFAVKHYKRARMY